MLGRNIPRPPLLRPLIIGPLPLVNGRPRGIIPPLVGSRGSATWDGPPRCRFGLSQVIRWILGRGATNKQLV